MIIEHANVQTDFSFEFQYWVDGEEMGMARQWWLESTSTGKGQFVISLLFVVMGVTLFTLAYLTLKSKNKDDDEKKGNNVSKNQVMNSSFDSQRLPTEPPTAQLIDQTKTRSKISSVAKNSASNTPPVPYRPKIAIEPSNGKRSRLNNTGKYENASDRGASNTQINNDDTLNSGNQSQNERQRLIDRSHNNNTS